MHDSSRPAVEVDLEVYLALRRLAEACEMWNYSQGMCQNEDEYHLSLISESVEELLNKDNEAHGPNGTSTGWSLRLPEHVQVRLEHDGYEFRFPEFEHEDCCKEDEDEK